MVAFWRRQVERLLAWLVCREAAARGWADRAAVERIAKREAAAVMESVEAHFEYQRSEAAILSERLGRRYDPGLALNEATSRAIAAKQAAGAPSPDNLTPRQKAALEFQKSYLQRVVKSA